MTSPPPLPSWRAALHRHATLLKDLALAGASFALDVALFALFLHATGQVFASVVYARVLSALFNFMGNRLFVFKGAHAHAWHTQLAGYIGLAIVIMLTSAGAVQWLVTHWSWPAVITKIGVDIVLYIASFLIRSLWLFRLQPPPQ